LKALISQRDFSGRRLRLVSLAQRRFAPLVFSKGPPLMQQMTLMTVGLYNEREYPYLPSILY